MTIAHWCLFAAGLLHVVSRLPMRVAQSREGGGYDRNNPRDQQARLTGWGRRARAAHENQLESFPLFAAGVLVALTAAPRSPTIDALAVTYIVARLAFAGFYLADMPVPRVTVWAIGYGVSLALLAGPAWGCLAVTGGLALGGLLRAPERQQHQQGATQDLRGLHPRIIRARAGREERRAPC